MICLYIRFRMRCSNGSLVHVIKPKDKYTRIYILCSDYLIVLRSTNKLPQYIRIFYYIYYHI
jgi:hypothetical protein